MKLQTIIALVAASIATSKAATVNVTGGFGTGVIVTTSTVNTDYTLEVGNYSANIFTAFAVPVAKTAGQKIAGGFTATGPTSLNGLPIFLRVSTGDGFAILSTNSPFPADVTSALASTTVSFTTSSSGSIVATGGANLSTVSYGNANNLNFVPIPEPSAALLSALGALGLLRRRRA